MTTCQNNCTNMKVLDGTITNEMLLSWDSVYNYFGYHPWVFSMIGSAIVGLSGVFPLLIIPTDGVASSKHGVGAGTLKLLLSFAVGSLLGDVFLHVLPEAWFNNALKTNSIRDHPSISCGLWILTGFLIFIIVEKMLTGINENKEDDDDDDINKIKYEKTDVDEKFINNSHDKKIKNISSLSANSKSNEENMKLNGYSTSPQFFNVNQTDVIKMNNYDKNAAGEMQRMQLSNLLKRKKLCDKDPDTLITDTINKSVGENFECKEKVKTKHISGYLNLLANCIDNFNHGLAVGGAFLVSFQTGVLTTFAIMMHEIPHEFGDFAILLRSGFNRWDAARAQLLTGSSGILGALFAVLCSRNVVEARTSWILPFTAGGFLHIGLVTILPEIQKESDPKESMKQLGALLSGLTLMAILTTISE